MRTLTLTKHHGLGNDFLVLIDTDDRYGDDDPGLARAVCDRHTGVGADGLIRLGPGMRMHLHNADGSRAETSGNGIRCLAQAIVDNGIHGGPDFEIHTDAGSKWVAIEYASKTTLHCDVTVDMGPAGVTSIEPERRAEVDMGNPHLVLLDEGQDLAELGRAHPDVNVELIRLDAHELVMRVHERGAGLTRACGTGSCASAAVAHAWGWTGTVVTVRNPGGAVRVELKEETVFLTGPAEFIARVEWPCR